MNNTEKIDNNTNLFVLKFLEELNKIPYKSYRTKNSERFYKEFNRLFGKIAFYLNM